MQGITFRVGEGLRGVGDVLALLPDVWSQVWRPVDLELVPCPGAEHDVSRAHRLADVGDEIPIDLLRRLADANVQMIGGEWHGLGRDGNAVRLVIRSVRGDEWDIEAADATVLDHIRRRVPHALDLPSHE